MKTITLRQYLGTNMHHRAKVRKDRSILCGDIAIFATLKMAAAAILIFKNLNF